MRIQRTLWRFPSPTPCWFFVRMYLCGYVVCSARAPAQHCRMCCANERNIVGPRFDVRETIEMLALVGSEIWPVSKFIQRLPTSRNNTQQYTTWCAKARNMLGPTMLRAFARALSEQNSKINISLFCFKGKQRAVKPPHSSRVALKWLPCKILYI